MRSRLGRAVGDGEGVVAGAEPLHILALRREHLRAVDRRERLARMHFGADVIDEQLFHPAGHAGSEDAVARVIVVHHAGDAQGAHERGAAHLRGLHPDDTGGGGRERDEIGIGGRRGVTRRHGDEGHAADGALVTRFVGLDPRVHGALVNSGRRRGEDDGGEEGEEKENGFHGRQGEDGRERIVLRGHTAAR